jgi:hypothetical protein
MVIIMNIYTYDSNLYSFFILYNINVNEVIITIKAIKSNIPNIISPFNII